MPSERREYGYKSVMKGLLRVIIAYKDIEDERDIDGEDAQFLGIFEFVPVIDVIVKISLFQRLGDFYLRLGVRILSHGHHG
jgi:hypothetical protein